MNKVLNSSHEDWVVYDFSDDRFCPPSAGIYTVIVDDNQKQAYFYGGGWWDSKYTELNGDISVQKWLRNSLVTEAPQKPWVNSSEVPQKFGEYEVLIDATWPLGGLSTAIWAGDKWINPLGVEVKITKWR